jgi:hypothetical protein
MSSPHAECAELLHDMAANLGMDVTVSTVRPLVAGPYTTDPFVCPHKVTFWLEPTGEQITRWAREGVQ